jgi:hypothetical protein
MLAREALSDVARHCAEVETLRADGHRTREVEQRIDGLAELRGLLLRGADLRRGVGGAVALRETQVAEDREERAAELVGDAGGEMTEAFAAVMKLRQNAKPPSRRRAVER